MNHNKYPLRVLFWEATLRCNAYCEFCGSRCGDVFSSNELTTNEICTVFKHISECYDPTKIMINVTGGEPLVREDLFEVMGFATSLGFRWGLVTNGMLISEKCIKKMKETDMKTISISIDGLSETHNRIRGVRDGFEKVIENIYSLKKANFLETIMITTVVSKHNFSELDKIKNLLCTQSIDIWRICPVDAIGRASMDNKLLLSTNQMKELFEFISICRNEKLPYKVTTSCSHYLGKYEYKVRDFPFQCNAGCTIASVLANGDIFVCPNVPRLPDLIQGNVRSTNFVDVWENNFQFYRDPFSRRIGDCKTCYLYSKCKADSLHTWDFENECPKFCIKKFELVESNNINDLNITTLDEIFYQYKGAKPLFDNYIKKQSISDDCIVIAPEVAYQMLSYFKWGTTERTNEKLCALYGEIFRDGSKKKRKEGVLIVVVKKIIPITNVVSDNKKLFFSTQTVNEAYLQEDADNNFLGFAHTHPNEMKIAMSLGDFKFHKNLYEHNWRHALSIIINPQKRQIAAYDGYNASHVDLHLLSDITVI